MKTNQNKMRRHCVKWRHVHTALKFEFSSNSKDWKSPTSYQQLSTTEHRAGCLQTQLCLCTSTLWAISAAIQEQTQRALSPCLFGEGDSPNSFGRKVCQNLHRRVEHPTTKEQKESLPQGERVGCRQAAYPPAMTPGGETQVAMVCEAVLWAMSCLWKWLCHCSWS